VASVLIKKIKELHSQLDMSADSADSRFCWHVIMRDQK